MGVARLEPPLNGAIDGTNRLFTIRPYTGGSVTAVWRGILRDPANEDGLVETNPSAGLVTMKEAPLSGDALLFFYTDTTNTDAAVYQGIGGNIIPIQMVFGNILPADEGATVSMLVNTNDNSISIERGEDRTVRALVTDENQVPVDLTGAFAQFGVKHRLEDTLYVIQKTSASSSQVNFLDQSLPQTRGMLDVFLVPSDTALLKPANYLYDLWVELANGKKYSAIPPTAFSLGRPVSVI